MTTLTEILNYRLQKYPTISTTGAARFLELTGIEVFPSAQFTIRGPGSRPGYSLVEDEFKNWFDVSNEEDMWE